MQVKVESDNQDIARISLIGRVDQSQFQPDVDPIENALGPAVYQRRLLLNLKGVELLDSSGVGWLLKCHRRFRDAGGAFVLHSLSPMVANVLRILRMDQVLHTASTEAEAVRRIEESRKSS